MGGAWHGAFGRRSHALFSTPISSVTREKNHTIAGLSPDQAILSRRHGIEIDVPQ